MYAQLTERLEETNSWCPTMAEGMPENGQTILLVEDEQFVREVTCEVLQSAGYRVLAAKNTLEAASLYEQYGTQVELLLTDMILPGETGLALACRLRRGNPRLNLLLVTGYAMQMELRELKPEEVLAKPFSTETLLRRVRHLLNGEGRQTVGGNSMRQACGAA
ncbi:MAG TPA: response regulator [Candidatus Sulfotelmatobacter sp.]|nr:response regulator [Candidatus Sulfotelmatobacter sp.]